MAALDWSAPDVVPDGKVMEPDVVPDGKVMVPEHKPGKVQIEQVVGRMMVW